LSDVFHFDCVGPLGRVLSFVRFTRYYGDEITEDDIGWLREIRNAYKILVGKPEGKRSLGRRRSRWKDIRMDLREKWRTLLNTVINLQVP